MKKKKISRREKSRRMRQRRSNSKLGYGALEPRRLLAPLVGDDFFTGVGNTTVQLSPGKTFEDGPSVKIKGSLFDNDDAGVELLSFDDVSGLGGSVQVDADGGFIYVPPAGQTGVRDSFSYTVTDGVESATATAFLDLNQLVWFVDTSAEAGGDGTSAAPFDSLDPLNTPDKLSDVDGAGDTIYIASGSVELESMMLLETGQRLIGQGVALVVDGAELQSAGVAPEISYNGDSGIGLDSDNQVRGLNVHSQRFPIIGYQAGQLVISDVEVTSYFGGLWIESSSAADVTIERTVLDVTGGSAIRISTEGALTTSIRDVSIQSGGIRVTSASAADVTIEGTDIEGGLGTAISIWTQGATTARVHDNTIQETGTGIWVALSFESDISIQGNTITDHTADAIYVSGIDWRDPFGYQVNVSGNEIVSPHAANGIHVGGMLGLPDLVVPVIRNNQVDIAQTSNSNFGVSVEGFSFVNEDFLDNQVSGPRYHYQSNGTHYQNVSIAELNLIDVSSISLASSFGELSIDRLNYVANDSHRGGLYFSGRPALYFEVGIGELNIDTIAGSDSELNTAFSTLNVDLTIESGSIVGNYKPLSLKSGPNDVNLGVISSATNQSSGAETTGIRLDTVWGQISFQDEVTLGRNHGIQIDSALEASIEFLGPVTTEFLVAQTNADLDVLMQGPVYATRMDLAGADFRFEGPVELKDDLVAELKISEGTNHVTRVEFVGGLTILAPKVKLWASGSELAIQGDDNSMVATGDTDTKTLFFYIHDTVVLDGGIQFEQIVGAGEIDLDLYRPHGSDGGDFVVTGPSQFTQLILATEVDVSFLDPGTEIVHHGDWNWALVLRTLDQVRPGSLNFHGSVANLDAFYVDFMAFVSTNEMTYDFYGELAAAGTNGILVGGSNATINFHEDVSMGTDENPNFSALKFEPGTDASVKFHKDFRVRADYVPHLDNGPAILLENSELASLYIEHLDARSLDADLIRADRFGTLVIADGQLKTGSGQLLSVSDGHAEIALRRVDARGGDGPAVQIQNTTGHFRVVGDPAGYELGGDLSGGIIVDRTDVALSFQNSENIQLKNLYVSRTQGDAIRAENVSNMSVHQSRFIENGTESGQYGIRVIDGLGDWSMKQLVMRKGLGSGNVSVTNRAMSEMSELLFSDNRLVGGGPNDEVNVLVSVFGHAQIDLIVEGNDFNFFAGDQFVARTNGFSRLDFSGSNNSFRDFKRGIGFEQRGASELTFKLLHNKFIGLSDATSSFAIYAKGIANKFGGGEIQGEIRSHRGTLGRIARTSGIRLSLAGYESDGNAFGTKGSFQVRNNLLEDYGGYAGINASVDGMGSQLNLRAELNAFVRPYLSNASAIRVLAGFKSPDSPLTANVTLKNNSTVAGFGRNAAGYQLVQREDATLNLTAPAGNSEIGNSFLHSDGGVIMSTGFSGNHNDNRSGRDVFVAGTVHITEESP